MSTVFNKLLIFLCLADLLFLLCTFVISLQVTLEVALPTSLYLVLECLCHLALSTSVFMTASATIERHQVGNINLKCLCVKPEASYISSISYLKHLCLK